MSNTIERLAAALADRYRIERELGQGGMATVYLAHDIRHHRNVAIKVMRPEVSAELAADRFLLEIRTTANLQHPHIVPVFDSGMAAEQLFFVMPLIEGESLRARLDREGPLPVADAVRLVREVAGALDYAHEQGILHRDLKPENIMLSRGHALLADFGIARTTLSLTEDRLTRTGTSIGTPAYMSPEQASGDQDLGPASDIYGLGAILFELLTGEPPFTGATFEAILVKRFTQDAPRLRTRRADTPSHCDAAVARALLRDPAQRFTRARDFGAALAITPTPQRADEGKSIAVLPFANLSPDAENAYFADGLTEEVITTLSKVRTLRVIARTTMMQYRDRSDAVQAAARDLGVTHVLEGSVRKGGDRLRIATSLVATDTEASLWSERFDGTLADVFDMQDRVAAAIVDALQVVLTPEETVRLVERPISNAEAYDCYLRARQGLNRLTSTGIQEAFDHLEHALVLAPDNPFLLRGMGAACFSAVNLGLRADAAELLDRALGYADAIEAIDPGSPSIREIRGSVAIFQGRPLDGLRDLGFAFEALPEDPDIPVWYGIMLGFGNRPEMQGAVGRDMMRRAPDHPLAWCVVALSEMQQGHHDQALELVGNAPDSAGQTFVLVIEGVIRLAAGNPEAAIASFDRHVHHPDDTFTALARFLGAACRGDDVGARAVLVPDVEATLRADFQYSEFIAEGFAMLGDIAEAARWLDHAVTSGIGMHDALTRHHGVWRPLLTHPALAPVFERLRRKADEYAMIPVAPRALALAAQERGA